MRKLTLIFIYVFSIHVLLNAQTRQIQTIHKYVVTTAWELVKNQHPGVQYSEMDGRIGWWQNSDYHGTGPWQMGKVNTGAFREDEEDPVFGYEWPNNTNSHFWDPEEGDCNADPDWMGMDVWPFGCYENSYHKVGAYWTGKRHMIANWLAITNGVVSGPYIPAPNYYMLTLTYNNLGDVYHYNNIFVTGAYIMGIPIHIYNPPEPLINFNLTNGTRSKIERVSWEIVGRICHLIEDASVPAHSHNDIHPFHDDWYETYYIPEHYQEYNVQSAINQANQFNQPPIISINSGYNFPLRFVMYTTNQLADRFPSNGADGDYNYVALYHGDVYSNTLEPIYQSISVDPYRPYDIYTVIEVANKSYVYSIRSTASFLWYVYDKFGIESTPPPIFSHFSQSPPAIPHGSNGYVTFHLSQGNHPSTSYNWRWVDMPSDYTPIPTTGPTLTLQYNPKGNNSIKSASSERAKIPKVFCWASNNYGNTPEKDFIVTFTTNGGGCPWVYVMDEDSVYREDNNILHRSEFPENQGIDIRDVYKLKVQPGLSEYQTIALKILESENDYSYFDQIKLYAVDHPANTKIDVDENNQIFMYDSVEVISTDLANRNDTNITDRVQYHIPTKYPVYGDTTDYIYSHFDPRLIQNVGVIMELESDHITPNINKTADHLFASTQNGYLERYFGHRENPSVVALPMCENQQANTIYNLDIYWNRDYKIKYIAQIGFSYDGFSVTELPLVSAIQTDSGDVYNKVTQIDQDYAVLDSSDEISLIYYNTESFSYPIRDYIIDISGRYIKLTGDAPKLNFIKDIKSSPLLYKLYTNYPNPFNPKTTIKYDIAKTGMVKIEVYDILGRLVTTLVNDYRTPGSYNVLFDGSNLASGVYIYKLESGNFTDVKKMVLIK